MGGGAAYGYEEAIGMFFFTEGSPTLAHLIQSSAPCASHNMKYDTVLMS